MQQHRMHQHTVVTPPSTPAVSCCVLNPLLFTRVHTQPPNQGDAAADTPAPKDAEPARGSKAATAGAAAAAAEPAAGAAADGSGAGGRGKPGRKAAAAKGGPAAATAGGGRGGAAGGVRGKPPAGRGRKAGGDAKVRTVASAFCDSLPIYVKYFKQVVAVWAPSSAVTRAASMFGRGLVPLPR